MLRGEVRGCIEGLAHGIGRVYGRFTETVFRTWMNFSIFQPGAWPVDFVFTRVRHEPVWHADDAVRGEHGEISRVVWDWPVSDRMDTWSLHFGRGPLIRGLAGHRTELSHRLRIAGSDLASPWIQRIANRWMLPPPECGTTMGESWTRCGLTLLMTPLRRRTR